MGDKMHNNRPKLKKGATPEIIARRFARYGISLKTDSQTDLHSLYGPMGDLCWETKGTYALIACITVLESVLSAEECRALTSHRVEYLKTLKADSETRLQAEKADKATFAHFQRGGQQ